MLRRAHHVSSSLTLPSGLPPAGTPEQVRREQRSASLTSGPHSSSQVGCLAEQAQSSVLLCTPRQESSHCAALSVVENLQGPLQPRATAHRALTTCRTPQRPLPTLGPSLTMCVSFLPGGECRKQTRRSPVQVDVPLVSAPWPAWHRHRADDSQFPAPGLRPA